MTFRATEVMVVSALSADPREVIVSDQTGSDRAVPCAKSYHNRAVGDVVLVVQLSGGSWLVLCAIGPDDTPSTSTATTISTTSATGWLTGVGTASPEPRGGATSDSSPDWFGAWFYAGQIAAACAGRTVAGMQVRITRAATGGVDGATVLRLGLHASTGLRPTITDQWLPGVNLPRGGSVVVDIPDTQVGLLATGTALGVAVYGQGTSEYALYTTDADLMITFS